MPFLLSEVIFYLFVFVFEGKYLNFDSSLKYITWHFIRVVNKAMEEKVIRYWFLDHCNCFD